MRRRPPRRDHANGVAGAQGGRRRLPRLPAAREAHEDGVRRRGRERGLAVRRRRRRARRKTRRASRSSGRPGKLLDNMLAAIGMKRGDERLHRQRAQVPAPEQPQRRSRGEAQRMPALPRPPDRAHPAEADRRAGQERRDDAARRRRDDREPARARPSLRGVPLIVTYHPAYLLRNLPDKAKAWEDLLLRGACATRMEPRPA